MTNEWKLLPVMAAVIAACTFSGCGEKGSKAGLGGRTVSFTTKEGPFEFTFPGDWYVNQKKHPYSLQCIDKPERMSTGVFVYNRSEIDAAMTPAKALTFHVSDLESKRTNFKELEERRQFEDGGRKFTVATYSGERDSSSNVYRFSLIEFVENPEEFLIVLQTALPEDWKKAEPVLDLVLRTAKDLRAAEGSGESSEPPS